MRVYPDRLDEQLRKTLSPIYLVSGDEPLIHMEACDAIRRSARAAGVEEREILHVETGFSWSALLETGSNLSLFGERRLVELRLGSQSPGQEGGRALEAWAQRAEDSDDILLVSAARLDRKAQQSRWFKALDRVGVHVPVWPVDHDRLHYWIRDRAGRHQLELAPDAARLLADRIEGNLLAADQALMRLALVHPAGTRLSTDDVASGVEDSARFDVFTLNEACLKGEPERAVRIITGLQGEGVEPPVILWAITRELRLLISIRQHLDQGQSIEHACKSQRPMIPDKRRPHYQQALRRLPIKRLQKLLLFSQRLDLSIKGSAGLPVWPAITDLALTLAGSRGPLTEWSDAYRVEP
ncbi:DNA polymerase III delta subunit [Kushneria sinocarnis]|uniref:DNA polymerase III subunit delta n=1 Tax=Kushneria sinocarnis TaxID=595502 RepID=A0A420WVW4_9GAMM|nr:DNA polymerase III subunit delta [Kushneria sinocarnis]RKR02672.1 DNA polymerase III delta subunit [Kushneria sinocarnis]